VIEPELNPLPAEQLLRPAARPAPRLGWEIIIVLALSLGQSAVYSILRIIERLTRPVPLSQQTSTLNQSVTPDRPWLDLTYQLAGIAFAVVPVLLALYLLRTVSPWRRGIGFDLHRPRSDVLFGLVIAAFIGIPGLGLYLGARALGLNTQVQASALADNWWTVPVLVLSAAQNAVLEEVVMIGYLFSRFMQLRWRWPWILVVSAVIRGSYHLYQGFGGFLGNVVMGLVFGRVWQRTGRLWPLVGAHAIIDLVAFVGSALLVGVLPFLPG
jgi:membrane protease YdiL (CAAX protease family)